MEESTRIIINTLLMTGSLIGAVTTITLFIKKIHKFITMQENVISDMKRVKQEQKLVFAGLCACLDGLEQLGCNHTVPQTKAQLEAWINEQAHD